MDQAGTLRKLMQKRVAIRPTNLKPLRVISVTSGKGGVGKTNIVANLSIMFQKAGHKVLILDGDFGLANLNIIMGLDAKYNIDDVIQGKKEMSDIILTGPQGVKVIPASSGIYRMLQLSSSEKSILMDRLENAPLNFDILLIDTGAGINADVAYLNAAATEVIVVATPEPTSIADAYALMKVMSQDHHIDSFKLVVNMVENERDGFGVYNHLLNVSDKFLNIKIEYLGHIFDDRNMGQAVLSRKVLCEGWPHTPAVQCLESIGRELITRPIQSKVTGNVQFFWRNILSEASL